MIRRLYQVLQVLLEEHRHGRRVVLLVDQAHLIPVQTLAELLMLDTLETAAGEPLLRLVYAGLPAFQHTLNRPELRPLKQRLATRLTLVPLTPKESLAYLRHRLAKVLPAAEDALFTPGAFKTIIRYARGSPRLLHVLCANALSIGALYQQRRITAAFAEEVSAEFRGKSFPRPGRRAGVCAAGLLLAGVVWSAHSGYLRLATGENLELSHLPRLISSAFHGHKEDRVSEVASTVAQYQPSIPPPPTAEPEVPAIPSTPIPTEPPTPESLVPHAPAPVEPEVRVAVVAPEREATPPVTTAPVVPPEPVRVANSPVTGEVRGGVLSEKALETLRETTETGREILPAGDTNSSGYPECAASRKATTRRRAAASGRRRGHAAIIRELLFTADGRDLISVGDDQTIRVWTVTPDGRHAALARTLRGQLGDGRAGMLAAAALSPPDATGRQRWLAVGGLLAGTPPDRYAVRLHDYASGEVVALLRSHDEGVLALAFAPTGRWLASAGKDRTVRLWDLAALQGPYLSTAPLVLTAHIDRVYDLAWSPTGDRLALASYDQTVGLWDTTRLGQGTVPLVARLRGHGHQVQTVAFHPEGTALASGGKDHTIRLWRAQNGEALGVLARAPYKVSALAFAPDGRLVLAGSESPPKPDRLILFAYPSGEIRQVFTGHQNVVLAMAFHPSDQWVATGGGEQKEILLWHAHTGEVLSHLAGRGRTIYAVGFSQDGRYLSWGHIIDAPAPNTPGSLEHRFDLTHLVRLPGGLPEATAIRAQGRLGALTLVPERGGPYDYPYRLHVHRGPQRLSTVEWGHTDGYRHSAYTFTPDGHGVLAGGRHGVLRLYTLHGHLRATLVGHTGEIQAVAVSADGRWAASGANDQTLRLWALAALPEAGSTELTPTLTLFPAVDGEWAAWTPEGFFAASPHGAQVLGYSLNQGLGKVAQDIPAEQWRERLYRPERILTKLHGDLHKQPYSAAR